MTDEPVMPSVLRVDEDTTKSVSADELIHDSSLTEDSIEAADELARAERKHGKPMVTLYDTQKAIIQCARKFIGAKCCRRYGKDFIFTLRISKKLHEHPRHKYHIFSRSQRQSGDSLAQLAVHLRAQEKALRAQGKRLSGATPKYDATRLRVTRNDGTAVEYTRHRVLLPNGSQAIALPASPDTCVGSTGSVWFNEFGVLPKLIQRDMYAYLQPMVSSRKEFELCASSTPRGLGTKFHEFFTAEIFAKIFALFIVDIFKAVREGAVYYDYLNERVIDEAGIARLKEALRDDDRWLTEYLVEFAADVLALLDFEMIGQCESLHDQDGKDYRIFDFDMPQNFDPAATSLIDQVQLKGGELFVGHDIARQKDLSVIWLDESWEGRLWQRAMITMKRIDFERQEAALWQFLGHPKLRKAGIDATGMGARTAERAVTRFGSRVVPVNFSSNLKDRHGNSMPAKALIARVMRERHQHGRNRYPILDKIRDDFIRVKRKAGSSPDTFTYFADSDETGHADIFTAAALSSLVAQELVEYGGITDGMRIIDTARGGYDFDNKLPPKSFPEDHIKPGAEWAGIGGAY